MHRNGGRVPAIHADHPRHVIESMVRVLVVVVWNPVRIDEPPALARRIQAGSPAAAAQPRQKRGRPRELVEIQDPVEGQPPNPANRPHRAREEPQHPGHVEVDGLVNVRIPVESPRLGESVRNTIRALGYLSRMPRTTG